MNLTEKCMNQRSDEWLKMRKSYIGASDAPIIMGMSPYMTAYELWLEKLGLGEEREITHVMQRGIHLEEIALEKFNILHQSIFTPSVIFHLTIPYLMASLDGFSYKENSILEIKCNNPSTHQKVINGEIPGHHYAQVQHQIEVAEVDYAYYWSFDGENGHKEVIDRDDEFIELMLAAEKEFWDCVTNLVPPKMTEKDRNRVKKEKTIDMSDNQRWNNLSHMYLFNVNLAKESEIKAELAKNEMIELANDKNCKGAGVNLCKVEAKGMINYKSIPELKGVDLEKYREQSKYYWKVLVEKEEENE